MRFRPEHDLRHQAVVDAEHDDNPGGPVEWSDNWLSNTFAWASYRLMPSWCQTPEHWTSRLTQYLFTDCPCCLLFRGITVGIFTAFAFFAVICAVLAISGVFDS